MAAFHSTADLSVRSRYRRFVPGADIQRQPDLECKATIDDLGAESALWDLKTRIRSVSNVSAENPSALEMQRLVVGQETGRDSGTG
jgi:hypothetical protein